MYLFKLNKTTVIDLPTSESIDLIKFKYSKLLNIYNFRTGFETNGISFLRISPSPSHSGSKRIDSISAFYEGFVFIQPEKNKLRINWLVKLDRLYFISFVIGICIGFLSSIFFDLQNYISIIIGLFGFILTIIIGRWAIIFKIIEININCLEE
jgi:hypothetical protein